MFDLPAGTFHALVGGDPTAPVLVFLHGFPDHPPTATPFLEHLARTHRVIAPWLRGYAPSPIVGPYDLDTLAADVRALIDALGGPVDLVGHDWGAVITYVVCGEHPELVRRAVTMSVPHPLTFLRALRNPSQVVRSSYMGLFQLPGSGWLVRRAGLPLIDRLWRTWSPGLRLGDDIRADLHACLDASLPAPLEYYRAMFRPLSAFRDRMRRAAKVIKTPLLQLHGAADGCILPPTTDDSRRFSQRELEVLPGLGHFLHIEDPERLASRVTQWLA
ncbi:MAG: alpha/beta hydrolase [Deltaproteobacteria bacterium]|nr:alpha/beta hydrolase [Deltaproteobacteria bacterium]